MLTVFGAAAVTFMMCMNALEDAAKQASQRALRQPALQARAAIRANKAAHAEEEPSVHSGTTTAAVSGLLPRRGRPWRNHEKITIFAHSHWFAVVRGDDLADHLSTKTPANGAFWCVVVSAP